MTTMRYGEPWRTDEDQRVPANRSGITLLARTDRDADALAARIDAALAGRIPRRWCICSVPHDSPNGTVRAHQEPSGRRGEHMPTKFARDASLVCKKTGPICKLAGGRNPFDDGRIRKEGGPDCKKCAQAGGDDFGLDRDLVPGLQLSAERVEAIKTFALTTGMVTKDIIVCGAVCGAPPVWAACSCSCRQTEPRRQQVEKVLPKRIC